MPDLESTIFIEAEARRLAKCAWDENANSHPAVMIMPAFRGTPRTDAMCRLSVLRPSCLHHDTLIPGHAPRATIERRPLMPFLSGAKRGLRAAMLILARLLIYVV